MELIGLVLPPVIDMLNQFIDNRQAKFLVAFAVCAMFGTFLNWLDTQFIFADPMGAFNSISKSILVVLGSSQITYNLGYKDSALQEKIRG